MNQDHKLILSYIVLLSEIRHGRHRAGENYEKQIHRSSHNLSNCSSNALT